MRFTVSDMCSQQWKKRVSFTKYPAGMSEWLLQTFGQSNATNYWTNNKDVIYFVNDGDLLLFKLKWYGDN